MEFWIGFLVGLVIAVLIVGLLRASGIFDKEEEKRAFSCPNCGMYNPDIIKVKRHMIEVHESQDNPKEIVRV